ncbi:MAG TPA: hydrogenase maturation protease, partial [Bryobacteraceae bacterium]|nr:hydrogenase maturation protease [Bryobacteraceae bacterium]
MGMRLPLIIGCGNPDRGDDGAGFLVAGRLRELGFPAVQHTGDGLALLDVWHGADDVILVDAMVSGADPGSVWVWDAETAPPGSKCYRGSTHVFGPGEAVELARVLGRLPARLKVYGIEASRFDHGAPVSSEVLAGVDRVVGE